MTKSKTPSISSVSLRSASRKSRHRCSNTKSNNHSQSFSKEKNHRYKKSHTTQIGVSSKKSIQCKGCKSIFRIYSDHTSFMNRHVLSNDKCPIAYPKCVPPCNKIFFDEKN